VVTAPNCLGTAEYSDVGLDVDGGSLEWFDLICDPQHGAIDFSDVSLYLEQHAETNDGMLSPLSTSESLCLSAKTSDYFWPSTIGTGENDVPFEKSKNDSMQTLLSNHAFPLSTSELPPQRDVVFTMLETPSSKSTGHMGVAVPTIPPDTMVQPPKLTQKEQKAWEYYTEIIFPSMFPFLPLDSAQGKCKKAIEASQNSASFVRQIVFQTEQYQASELRRFGLGNTKDLISGRSYEQPMSLQRYGDFDSDCLLHIIIAQVSIYQY